MANLISSKKDTKRNKKRRAVNIQRKSELRTLYKKLISSINSGKYEESQNKFREYTKKVDTAAGKKLIKLNKAARQKSRVAKKINKLQA